MPEGLTIYFPISFALITDLQQTVLRVVALLAIGTFQIAAPGCSLTIVVFRDREGGSTAAGDDEHFEPLVVRLGHFS